MAAAAARTAACVFGALGYGSAVVADAVLRAKADACPQYPHAKATKLRDRAIHREPCDVVGGHDIVVYERVFRVDQPHQTAAAQREAELHARAQSAVVSALTLSSTRLRVQRWFSSSPPGPAATSDGGHAAGEPRFTVERYRSVTLEPRRRSGDAASPAPSTAEEHLAAMAGQEPDAVIAGILNGVASASTDQSMVKCVDADPNAACVADPAILCPEYLRAMADAAASKAVGPRGDDKVAASCLMLGGGAGCLAHHMLDRSRGSEAGAIARFVSVDAEPRMISAGQTLLGVTDGALETRCADALKYAREHPHEQGSFDAVFVDLFVGAEVPKVFRGAAFIADLKRLAKPHGGTVIANLPAADADYKLACEAAFGQGAVTETRVTRGSNVIVTCTRGD